MSWCSKHYNVYLVLNDNYNEIRKAFSKRDEVYCKVYTDMQKMYNFSLNVTTNLKYYDTVLIVTLNFPEEKNECKFNLFQFENMIIDSWLCRFCDKNCIYLNERSAKRCLLNSHRNIIFPRRGDSA